MMQIILFGLICSLVIALVSSTPLDDYIWRKDDNYGWVEMDAQYQLHGLKKEWTVC
jgi:hypothetical protein